jgi:hypothetical protein
MDRGGRTSWYARTRRITLPATGPVYLAFRHFVDASDRYDGGIVEYTTNASGAGGWTDLRGHFTANGYDAKLLTGYHNPLGGRRAFTGFSVGFQTTIANVSFLEGQKVYFRFRFGDDDYPDAQTYGNFGWMIDDVRVYRCVGPDSSGPTVTGPTLDLATGTVETDDTPIPVRVTFTASDPSGIAGTFLQRRLGAGSFLSVPLPGAKTTSLTTSAPDSIADGQTWKAGARDAVGNTGTDVTAMTIRAIQETGGTPAVAYTGAWSTDAAGGYFGGGVNHASAPGRKATVTVDGATDLAWVSTKGPDRGKAAVYIDGVKKATIDLYSATTKLRQVVYTIAFGSAASHTIEVRVLGTKNAASSGRRVDLDAFEVIGS